MGIRPQARSSPIAPGFRASIALAVALIQTLGGLEVVVVAEVGADNEPGLGAAPKGVQDLADFFGGGVANSQRDQREVAQDSLEERQLHLDRVFLLVGLVQLPHLRQRPDLPDALRHPPARPPAAWQRLRRNSGQPLDRDVMRRPEQDDPLDLVPRREELRVSRGGDGPGVKVTGMRRDQGLGPRPGRRGHLGQKQVDQVAQFGRIARDRTAPRPPPAGPCHVRLSRTSPFNSLFTPRGRRL